MLPELANLFVLGMKMIEHVSNFVDASASLHVLDNKGYLKSCKDWVAHNAIKVVVLMEKKSCLSRRQGDRVWDTARFRNPQKHLQRGRLFRSTGKEPKRLRPFFFADCVHGYFAPVSCLGRSALLVFNLQGRVWRLQLWFRDIHICIIYSESGFKERMQPV